MPGAGSGRIFHFKYTANLSRNPKHADLSMNKFLKITNKNDQLPYVYCLKHPRADRVYYVGESTLIHAQRLYGHISGEATLAGPVNKNLRKIGLKPGFLVLETMIAETPKAERERRQDFWIDTLRGAGCPILNLNAAGRAANGKASMSKIPMGTRAANGAKIGAKYGAINGRAGAIKQYKACIAWDPDTNEYLSFKSTVEAARQTGIDTSPIIKCCNNKPQHLTAGGLIWR